MSRDPLRTFERVLKAAAFTFLCANGVATIALSNSYKNQFDWQAHDPVFFTNDNDVYDDQKAQLLVLGIFTLILMFVYIIRGSIKKGSECGPFVISCGYLCSGICFIIMRYTICDVDCVQDIIEDAVDEVNVFQYLLEQLEDKVDMLRLASIFAGFGFYLAIAGYCPSWCKKQASCISALLGFLGLNAAAIGFIGAFIKYHELFDGDHSSHHDVDVAQNHVTSFLLASGVGFILAGIGEAASIFTNVDKPETELSETQSETQPITDAKKKASGVAV